MSEGRARPAGAPIRVFLVDDHDVVRSTVRDLLTMSGGIEVVGEAASALSAAGQIVAALPDVAVVDLRLGDGSGIEVCRDVSAQDTSIATLVLTADDDDQAAVAAVLAGARGYVLKLVRGARLVESVREVAQGVEVLGSEQRERALTWLRRAQGDDRAGLSSAQAQVLDLVCAGRTNPQIAASMIIDAGTVSAHVSTVLDTLGFPCRERPRGDGNHCDESSWS